MKISYLGKVSVGDIFECQMCGQKGRDKYLATPEVVTLVDWRELHVCKKCARREMGSKNAKKWDKLHGQRSGS